HLSAEARGEPRRQTPCRHCRSAIVSAGLLPRNRGTALCLACLARLPDSSFAERLIAVRLARGLTVKELADACQISKGLVLEYETGRAEPGWRRLMAVVRVLGTELVTLGHERC